jgi:ATP-dependent Clp protease ATP-binding subunit ClpC
VFERFTDDARRVVVLAQEEAHLLNHTHIGTEHLLLGLIREGDEVAAKALESLGISLEVARTAVENLSGRGDPDVAESSPFSDRARTVLELSMREARRLGDNRIGTHHILLGIIREGDGVAARAIEQCGVDLPRVRQRVSELLPRAPEPAPAPAPAPPEGSIQFAEEGEDPNAFARRVGIDPNLRVVLDHGTANAIVYVLEGLEQMFRLDPPTAAQIRHFPEPFDGFSRTVLEGALEELRRQLPPKSPPAAT